VRLFSPFPRVMLRFLLWTPALLVALLPAGYAAGLPAPAAQHAHSTQKHPNVHKKTQKRHTRVTGRGRHASASARTHTSRARQAGSHRAGGRAHRHLHRVHVVYRHGRHRKLSSRELARTVQLHHAFVASELLRPMAQQLGDYRSPAAYAGVEAYARAHSGSAAAAAYLALGHAHLLDHRYDDALADFSKANAAGNALDDYADYFSAQADLQSNHFAAADTILSTFATKYPDSIFAGQTPILQANVLLLQNQAGQAQAELTALAAEPVAAKPGYLLALAKADTALGQTADALVLYRRILNAFPLSAEAGVTQTLLQGNGQWLALPVAERRRHADALLNGGRYKQAALEFRALAAGAGLSDAERDGLLLSAATCDEKLNHLSADSLSGIPDTDDENGAHRLYLLLELARSAKDTATLTSLDDQLRSRFPTSEWLAEALLSSGNMYMLERDYTAAIPYYIELARRFPQSSGADNAHWRATWLEYRLRNFAQAATMMDEQLRLFPDGPNTPAAVYWRGRLYLDQARDPATAAAYFQTDVRVYQHYYYAAIARERLDAIGPGVTPASIPFLDAMEPEQIPELTEYAPQDDPHLAKAHLLANAGLNDYLSPEIHAAEGSDHWGALALANLYNSFGESYKAMRELKSAIPYYTSAPIDELPLDYWNILFPRDYWATIQTEAARNGLDPYMVASLIRQESEFNPRVVSYANAWGLMQLLPSTGRAMARKIGYSNHLPTEALLDPAINIKLGCAYLKQTLDLFGGHQEYAFASYNAGESRVQDWESSNDYTGMDEFVESIPFTQTRNYVQALMRNEDIYRELAAAAKTRAAIAAATAHGTSPGGAVASADPR
jgi:soluble lytic murein transglycosylase